MWGGGLGDWSACRRQIGHGQGVVAGAVVGAAEVEVGVCMCVREGGVIGGFVFGATLDKPWAWRSRAMYREWQEVYAHHKRAHVSSPP